MEQIKLTGNSVLTVLLVLSSIINIGLGHKVRLQKEQLEAIIANAPNGKSIVGTRVSALDVKDADGHRKKLVLAQGSTPTLVYIFRSTCGLCAKNLPNIKELDRYSRQSSKLNIIGLSLDGQDDLKQYAESTQLTFPMYNNVAPDDIGRLGLGETPQTILISSRGTIMRNWRGVYSGVASKEIESLFGVKLPGMAQASNTGK